MARYATGEVGDLFNPIDFRLAFRQTSSGEVIKMQMWDTQGFGYPERAYLHAADAVLIMIDTGLQNLGAETFPAPGKE